MLRNAGAYVYVTDLLNEHRATDYIPHHHGDPYDRVVCSCGEVSEAEAFTAHIAITICNALNDRIVFLDPTKPV